MLSLMPSSSSAGTTVRIVRSILSTTSSVCSMRVPVGIRTCRLIMPASIAGKEILADHEQQRQRRQHDDGDADQREIPARDELGERETIRVLDPLEAGVEGAHDAAPSAAAKIFLVILREQKTRHRRNQRARQQVRREHREDDRQRERREQEFRDSGQQHDREKDDADGKRADEGRRRRSATRRRESRPAAACASRGCDGCFRLRPWRHRPASRPPARSRPASSC